MKQCVREREKKRNGDVYICVNVGNNYKFSMHLIFKLMRPALADKNTDADVKSAYREMNMGGRMTPALTEKRDCMMGIDWS